MPALLALTFVYVRGERLGLLSVAAAGFVLTVVHPNYAPYVAMVLAGCVAARFLVMRRRTATGCEWAPRSARFSSRACSSSPGLWPVLSDTTPFTPDADTVSRDQASA